MSHFLEEGVRQALHPDVEQARAAYKPMEYNPRRPVGPGQPPFGGDRQGRYPQAAEQPQAAEPCIDPEELGGPPEPPPEPWWPYILGAVCGLLALVLVFGGVLK